MPLIWDVEDILQLSRDGFCVGYAPSKHRECWNRVNTDNRRTFNSLTRILATQQPDAEQLRPTLETLAYVGLCVAVHRWTQVDNMVEKWCRRITAAFPPQTEIERLRERIRILEAENSGYQRRNIFAAVNRYPAPSRLSISDISTLDLSRSSTAISNQPTDRRTPPIESPSRQLRMPRAASSVASRTPSSSARYPAPSFLSSPAQSSFTTVTRPTARSVASAATAISPSPSTAASSSAPPVSTPTSSSRASSRTRPCSRIHVRRLPFDKDCDICYEGGSLAALDASQLVWCRSGCGQTVHRSCFGDWRRQCAMDNRPLTCTICRTSWSDECECTTSCRVQHAQRRPVEDECPICRDELKDEDGNRLQIHKLAWCKSGCGGNVHPGCFQRWKEEREANGWTPNCVRCRATWSDECEC